MPEPRKYEITDEARQRPATCKNCQQENLYWAKTPKGKYILVEPDGVCHWEYCGK